MLSGCSFLERIGLIGHRVKPKYKDRTEDPGKLPPTIYDIDNQSGIQFYLGRDMVQNFPLPNGDVTRMILIPGGEFIMGLNDEDPLGIQPSGSIRMTVNAYWMDQTEVTNKQYRAFLNSLDTERRDEMLPDSVAWTREIGVPWSVYFRDEAYEDYPVTCVTWHQAKAYAEWAGKRLPSEVEWEYAARSGVSGRIYPWDGIYSRDPYNGLHMANFAPDGNHAVDGFVITSPAGTFPPNNFRLFDMAGNVAEWCEDAYFPSYKILKQAAQNLITPKYQNQNEPRKIVRGGSWASDAFFIGVGVRDYRPSKSASPRVGFRCVKPVENPFKLALAQRSREKRANQRLNPNAMDISQLRDSAAVADSLAMGGGAGSDQGGASSAQGSNGTFMDKVKDFGQKVVEFFQKPFGKTGG
jgi:formylglycine-generating enzyme required for sulfatase activity